MARCSEEESLRAFARIAALTPGDSWGADREFGIRDLLEGARRRPDLLLRAKEVLADSLARYEIGDYKVTGLTRVGNSGTHEFVLTLSNIVTGAALEVGLGTVMAEAIGEASP